MLMALLEMIKILLEKRSKMVLPDSMVGLTTR
jgi:hypothetical protein